MRYLFKLTCWVHLLIGLLWVQWSWAQQPLYRHIGMAKGLTSHNVYTTFQDRDGYIWFATDEGVCRYDGVEFVYFTTDAGLCDNEVLKIRQDSNGRVWFLTLSGCFTYFKDGKIYNIENEQSLNHSERTLGSIDIIEDDRGVVYIYGISNVLLAYDGTQMRSYRFFNEDLALPTITFGFKSSDGLLCFVNQGLIFELRNDALYQVPLPQMKYSRPNCATITPHGPMLMINDGLMVVDKKGNYILAKSVKFPSWQRFQSIQYIGNSFWFTLIGGGVEEWRLDSGDWVKIAEYLPNAIVNGVFEDREKNLWFSTRDRGVFFLPSHTFGHYFYPLEKSNVLGATYHVSSIAHLVQKGIYLVATNEGGIYSFDYSNKNAQLEHYAQAEIGVGLEELLVTTDGRAICINHKGIFWVEKGHMLALDPKLNLEIPKAITLDHNGGAYVSSLIHCIHIPDLNKPSVWYILEAIPKERVYHLCVDNEGKLWFEQHDKLYGYHNNIVEPHEAFNLMSKGRISDIKLSGDGRIIVATYGSGVFILNQGRIDMHFDAKHGLNTNECKFITCFGKQLYMHTSAGLWMLDCANDPSHTPKLLRSIDNLVNKKMSGMIVGEDQFYFGTHTGLYSSPINGIASKAGPESVVIEGINKQVIPNLDMLKFRYDYGQFVSIEFTANCLAWSKDLEFQYRLNNLDTNWITTNTRVVDFSQLPWGTNVFQVRSRNPLSNWTLPRTVFLEIQAPFYASWWFRSLIFVLLLSVTYLIVQFFIKRKFNLRIKHMESDRLVLAERNRISADLHDEIGAEVSNIVILSRIAQAKVKNNDSPSASIDKIDKAANNMINKMNGIIWSLNPANDDLVSLVEYLKRYGNDYYEMFDYSGSVEVIGQIKHAQVKGIVRRNAFLILKEALQNVHKHADATDVKIRITIETKHLMIEVIDNGVGFDSALNKRGCLGLTSIKRRASDVNGEVEILPVIGTGTTIRAKFLL